MAWAKMPATTPGEIQAVDWLASDPKGFRNHYAALERQEGGDATVEAGEIQSGAKPMDGQVCPTCGEVYWSPGCERGLEAGRAWLEANK